MEERGQKEQRKEERKGRAKEERKETRKEGRSERKRDGRKEQTLGCSCLCCSCMFENLETCE